MGAVFQFSAILETFGACCNCGIQWAAPQDFVREKLNNGGTFYCPNGHPQHFAETNVAKLEKQLAQEKQRREWAEKNAETARKAEAIARGKLKAQSERVKNGVCPCCNRSFQNLMRHMATKHPEFGSKDAGTA